MHLVPPKITDNIMKIYHKIGGKSIQYVDIEPEPHSIEFDCHNNCELSKFERVTGFYVVMDLSIGCYNLVKHSVVKKHNKLVDITPSKVDKHLFIECDINILNYKFYSYLEGYLYMNYTEMKNLKETQENYYVYALIDPRKYEIFYVGKGCKNRWLSHMNKKQLQDGTRKSNTINKIHSEGLTVGVKFLEKNIKDEKEAYTLEESYIRKYGRIVDGGILTNVTLDSNPPNHRGKTYEEIYGSEKAVKQRLKRRQLQLDAGGYGPENHTTETKNKISITATGIKNGNSSKLTEEDYINYGKKFCNMFNNEISLSKWKYFCLKENIPLAVRSFRFDGEYILQVYVDKLNAKIVTEKQLWFNNKIDQIRLSLWYIDLEGIPDGYSSGRLSDC